MPESLRLACASVQIAVGQRDDAMFTFGVQLLREGIGRDEILARLM